MGFEVEVLKEELNGLLKCLENIQNHESDDQLLEQLRLKNQKLEEEIYSVKRDSELVRSELDVVKERLGCELETLKSENLELLRTVDSARAEKGTLLETNQSLFAENEALKVRLAEVQEVSFRQSDKIIALRSVAKALECENELLSRENGRQQIKGRDENGGNQDNLYLRFRVGELESELNAKEEERKGFMQCFEKLTSESLNRANKISGLEKDLEVVRAERDELKTSVGLSSDTLDALRQSKRLVENKYQNVVEVCDRQSRELESLAIEKLGLEDQLSLKTANLVALQQELELQATVYESTMNEMQRQLDKRLDEISASKDKDTEDIRDRYVELFDEKARELNRVESEYAECKEKLEAANRRLMDSEYKEQELLEVLQRKESFADSSRQVNELVEALTKRSAELEDQLNRLNLKHESLQTSYLCAVRQFKEQVTSTAATVETTTTSENGTSSPNNNVDDEWLPEQVKKEQICDVKCSEKTGSSKKKKKRAAGKCR